ncbi:MAG: hypothetical protein P8L85_03335 [Rubripirellula sp.]|nr:hypothetical protein [Rubripirellula sp.]
MSLKQICCCPFALMLLLLGGITLGGITVVPAQAGLRDHCIGDQTGCCKRCPACDYCCNLDAQEVDEEKTCFEVESKEICIPRVVFPWQKKTCRSCDSCSGLGCNACVHNGAKVRRICVLKTRKYACPKCKYTWTPQKDGCDVGGCDTGCDVGVNGVIAPPLPNAPQPITSSKAITQPSWSSQQNMASQLSPVQQPWIPTQAVPSVQPQLATPSNGLVPVNVRPWASQPSHRSVWPVPLPTAN